MKVNIYYGGRGLIEDPTIHGMNIVTKVLEELNVNVVKYNLYEEKNSISALPKTLKDADACVLAASVEWFGCGGLLQQFLDACWLYGDKEYIKHLYMMPLVLSTTYGEQDVYLHLKKAWYLLGGKPCDGIAAYVSSQVDFETNREYSAYIDKKTEDFYRIFNKKQIILPTSINTAFDTVSHSTAINLTPQESEQLSMYVSNETYVRKQKEDIKELSALFRKEMGDFTPPPAEKNAYIDALKKHFHPLSDIAVTYLINITDTDKKLFIKIDDDTINCTYDVPEDITPGVLIGIKKRQLESILAGDMTMQKAFMTEGITARGDINILRSFDSLFQFQ